MENQKSLRNGLVSKEQIKDEIISRNLEEEIKKIIEERERGEIPHL